MDGIVVLLLLLLVKPQACGFELTGRKPAFIPTSYRVAPDKGEFLVGDHASLRFPATARGGWVLCAWIRHTDPSAIGAIGETLEPLALQFPAQYFQVQETCAGGKDA